MKVLEKISIICPVWNGLKDLPDLFETLLALDYDTHCLDMVVVDNASSDGSVEFVKKAFIKLKKSGWRNLVLIENKENIGIPAAYNKAFEYVKSDVFALLRIETDVILDKNILNNFLEIMRKESKVGIVGGLVKGFNDKLNQWGAIYFSKITNKYKILFPEHPVKCDGVLGCAMLIKRDCVKELEYLFDPNLFIGGDETDLSFRLAKKGYATWYQPKAIIYHKSGHSTSQIPSVTRYYYIRNGVILLRKHANFFKMLNSLIYYLIWVIWKRLKGEKIPWKAFKDGIFFDINNRKIPKMKTVIYDK